MQNTSNPRVNNALKLAGQAALSGTLSSVLTMLVMAVRGKRDAATPYGPLNAPSHWLYGDEALHADRPSWRHTFTGILIHQASSMLWGMLYDGLFFKQPQQRTVTKAVAGAVGVTAVAALIDLKVVPPRFAPGFERRLSSKSLAMTYVAFAAGLAVSGILLGKRR